VAREGHATGLCIDRLRKAKREEYVGQWLPEPVPDTWAGAAVEDRAGLAESLSMAFLVLLEILVPAELAAYLFREDFGYDFVEIAELIGKSPVDARQIAARAKKRLDAREKRFTPATGTADELTGTAARNRARPGWAGGVTDVGQLDIRTGRRRRPTAGRGRARRRLR
jgi:RNA polymerase sigma-70 factor (ECF subfamily)